MASESVDIRPLSSDLLPDFLEYFEGSAFADNPGWRSCYCQFLYVDHSRIHWAERTAEQNRRAACERICSSRMQGHLAYRKGQVVGWCNAAPRAMMDAFASPTNPILTPPATPRIITDRSVSSLAQALLFIARASMEASAYGRASGSAPAGIVATPNLVRQGGPACGPSTAS